MSDEQKKDLPCWKYPNCNYAGCKFAHRAMTPEEKAEKDKAKRRRKSTPSAAPAVNAKPCSDFAKGSCSRGEACWFSHAVGPNRRRGRNPKARKD